MSAFVEMKFDDLLQFFFFIPGEFELNISSLLLAYRTRRLNV